MGGIPSRLRQRDAIASASRARKAAHHIGEDFMNSLFKRTAAVLPAVALAVSCAVASAGELNSAAVTYKLPDQIQWSAPSPAGAQNALLAGDPTKEGLYVQLVKWPAGNHFSRPHFHPHDRFITVIKGTWWVGTGTKYDPDSTVAMPAGTFVTHFGQQVHYDGAKDEDAILLIVGEGPGTSTPAEVK
jgi:quercetin dioxygenase-like cupin family protein